MKYAYVYILRSHSGGKEHYYAGFTEDPEARMAQHNARKDPHTAEYAPWKIQTAIALTSKRL